MNFDELERVWSAQEPPRPSDADLAALKQTVMPEIRRRARYHGYVIFTTALAVVVTPLLAVANRHYSNPQHSPWYWISAAVWTVVWLMLLGYSLRKFRRHRALGRQPAGDLRTLTRLSLHSIEAEARDSRAGLVQAGALLTAQLLTLYLRFPPSQVGLQPFALRAGITVGLCLLVGLPLWRHYRVNLIPDEARHRELLRELESDEG